MNVLMNESEAILIVMSRILEYPEEDFASLHDELIPFIKEHIPSKQIKNTVLERLNALLQLPLNELQELYVDTFDYKEKTSLYLTAHELGDSPKRGTALIQLKSLIEDAGFQLHNKQLADYIPMLLEFLVVAPEEKRYYRLSHRISIAVERILEGLTNGHPYYQVMELLVMYVFEKPNKERLRSLENHREEADLDELPYPMMYL